MLRNRFLTQVVCLSLVLMCGPSARAQAYAGPHALGSYEIGHKVLIRTLSSSLGKPIAPRSDAVLCYRSADLGHLWIKSAAGAPSRVGGVLLSDFPNCLDSPVMDTSGSLRQWKTTEGIGLGSTTQSVLAAYGKPSRNDLIKGVAYRWVVYGDYHNGRYSAKSMPERGDEVLVYLGADVLSTAEFGLRNGRVVWIFLSEDE